MVSITFNKLWLVLSLYYERHCLSHILKHTLTLTCTPFHPSTYSITLFHSPIWWNKVKVAMLLIGNCYRVTQENLETSMLNVHTIFYFPPNLVASLHLPKPTGLYQCLCANSKENSFINSSCTIPQGPAESKNYLARVDNNANVLLFTCHRVSLHFVLP